jgi:hypothetical protein
VARATPDVGLAVSTSTDQADIALLEGDVPEPGW